MKYLNKDFKINTNRTLDDPLNADFVDINEISLSDVPNENISKKNTLAVADKLNQIKDDPATPTEAEAARNDFDKFTLSGTDAWNAIYKSMTPQERINFHKEQRQKKIQDDIEKYESNEYEKYREKVKKYDEREYSNYNTRTANYRKFKNNPLILEKGKEIGIEAESNIPKIDSKIFQKSEAELQIEKLLRQHRQQKEEHSKLVNESGIARIFWFNGGPINFK